MVVEDTRVHCLPEEAEWVERILAEKGLCNWLVDYGPRVRVYCGQPATEGLCTTHVHNMFG